jgi:pimeloyl-ACP methyl ester carboxylesterase
MARDLSVEPFRALLDPEALAELRDRLSRRRLLPADTDGWERGVPRRWLAELLADWLAFDFTGFQAQLDELTHLRVHVEGQSVHLVHAPGVGPDPLPLVLTHGWPGSFCEHLRLLPLLTDPAAHGGDPADAFTVVVPSLPGFGFSASPLPGGLTAEAVAGLWHPIMTEGLGYPRYAAHGSDLGAGVTARLARSHPDAVAGIHLATPGLPAPPRPWTPTEQAYVTEVHRQRTARLRPGSAAGHADPLLGHRHRRVLAAALLGGQPHARQRAACRGPAASAHHGERLRRRTRPVPQATPGTRRALLHAHRLARARPWRPLPGSRRAPPAGRDPPRHLPSAAPAEPSLASLPSVSYPLSMTHCWRWDAIDDPSLGSPTRDGARNDLVLPSFAKRRAVLLRDI